MKKTSKNSSRLKRHRRVRAKVKGNSKCPRLAVFRSLRQISVQAIDDERGLTLAAAYTRELAKNHQKNTVASAREIGKMIAKKCLEKGINSAVFDRGGYRYHGRVKSLAEGAREGGLKF